VITIRVPASTSNLGAGFDTLGLALDLYLDVTPQPCDVPGDDGTIVELEGEGAGALPTGPENLVNVAYRLAAARENVTAPSVKFRMRNEIPVSRGLGSSAAAAVAGLIAFEAMTGVTVPVERLLAYGVELEGHCDNVGASVLGGFLVCSTVGRETPNVVRMEWPDELSVVAVIPDVPLDTAEARRILPREVPRADAIFNVQRAALFVAALAERRFELLADAMRDRLHQPYREALLPGLDEALALGPDADTAGVALSGAGSTVVALATGDAEAAGRRVARCFERHGIRTVTRVLRADTVGRRVLSSSVPSGGG
jgi:homoserine kinase